MSKEKLKSNCCSAPFIVVRADEGTCHWQCTICLKPCDPLVEKELASQPAPESEIEKDIWECECGEEVPPFGEHICGLLETHIIRTKEHSMKNFVCQNCGAIEEDTGFDDGCKKFNNACCEKLGKNCNESPTPDWRVGFDDLTHTMLAGQLAVYRNNTIQATEKHWKQSREQIKSFIQKTLDSQKQSLKQQILESLPKERKIDKKLGYEVNRYGVGFNEALREFTKIIQEIK